MTTHFGFFCPKCHKPIPQPGYCPYCRWCEKDEVERFGEITDKQEINERNWKIMKEMPDEIEHLRVELEEVKKRLEVLESERRAMQELRKG